MTSQVENVSLTYMEIPSYETTPFKTSTLEALWRKNILSEKIDTKEFENYTSRIGDGKTHVQMGLLEMALLSERVVMSRVTDCTLSPLQTEILATLVPDELIDQQSFMGKPKNRFVGVLMFGDVSGFTALCEIYKKMGQIGTYKLTVTLNSYIGAMVDVIYSFGGDIIKFSGDAFLAVWKVTINDYIFSVIHKAIECAMHIQYSLGSYTTEVNVLLRVKLAISCGNLLFSCIGESNCKYYVIYGQPVDDVKVAQDLCKSGDIIAAASAWNHCSLHNYLYTWIDKEHIRIDRIVYNPMELHNSIVPLPVRQRIDIDKKYRNEILRFKNIGNHSTEAIVDVNHEEKTCRPKVKNAAEKKIGSNLRQYVIPPVVAQIDAEQSLEYLTEMRQTTTVFVNLILDKDETNVGDIINKVDEVYTIIWQIVYKEMGVVNKVCMFDKDVMFLVIFGLRGARHEYNAIRSLKCAHRIRSIISKLPAVITISCGVTVGTTYCGVVGHPLRQEYTIIGAPVNKAARLMVYYPNMVSCDQATFFNSGLSTVYFQQLETKTLKGLGKVTGIYEYIEGQAMTELKNVQLPVMLGMQVEIETFRKMLKGEQGFPVGILLSGDTGVGKTRLLTELSILCVGSHLRPIFLTLNAAQIKKPYIVLRYLYREIFDLSSDIHISGISGRIENLYAGTDLEMFTSLMNPVLNLELPNRIPKTLDLSDEELLEIQKTLIQRLVESTAINLAIFIDNMEFCDTASVECMQMLLAEGGSCLLAMTCNRARSLKVIRWFSTAQAQGQAPKVTTLELENLDEELLPALACQILNVRAIPKAVQVLICNHAEANPGWCQRYLQSLTDSKAIQVIKVLRKECDKMDNIVVPDYKLLHRRSITQEGKHIISVHCPTGPEDPESEVDICILESTEALNETVPASIEAIIMSAFDSLQPFEQLLLKCASVIGDIFPRDFLVAMLQNKSLDIIATATKRLYDMHILCCYNEILHERSQSMDSRLYDTVLMIEPSCCCTVSTDNINFNDRPRNQLPNYAFCQELAFTVPLFRHKTYDLLPLNQKHMFHARASKYLENLLKSGSLVDDLRVADFKSVSITTAFTYRPLIYDQLIMHTQHEVVPVKEIYRRVEFALYSILRNCPRRALTHLEKAIDMLEENAEIKEFLDTNMMMFKVKTLAAQAHVQLDNSFVATIEIKQAISFQNVGAIFNQRLVNLKMRFKEIMVMMQLDRNIGNRIGSQQNDRALCFIICCDIKIMDEDLQMARLLALESVQAVLRSYEVNLAYLFTALANLLEISCRRGLYNFCNRIIDKGRIILGGRVKGKQGTNFVPEEMAIGKFLSSAFKCKLLQGDLIDAFELGKVAVGKAETCNAEAALLRNSCFFIKLAIHLKKLDDAVPCIKKLRKVNNEISSTCYFIFVVYLNLYTGLVVESPHKTMEEVNRGVIDLERPLGIVLGLFYIRRDEMNKFRNVEQILMPSDITIDNVSFEIMFLEFQLVRLVRHNDSNQIDKKVMASEWANIISNSLTIWQLIRDKAMFLLPRLYFLMAYMYRIHKLTNLYVVYLNKAESESYKIGDILEAEWISFNKDMWSNDEDHHEDEIINDWIYRSSRHTHVQWDEENTLSYYPLPLPKEPLIATMNFDHFNIVFQYSF